MSLCLSDDQLFIRPKHNIFTFFMILFCLFVYFIQYYHIVCQICHVNDKKRQLKTTEN